MIQEITAQIKQSLPEAEVHVLDPNNDGMHFQAFVISPTFEGLSLVKQHQIVMNALKEDFKERVHALGLKTFTPKKWDTVKDNYPI